MSSAANSNHANEDHGSQYIKENMSPSKTIPRVILHLAENMEESFVSNTLSFALTAEVHIENLRTKYTAESVLAWLESTCSIEEPTLKHTSLIRVMFGLISIYAGEMVSEGDSPSSALDYIFQTFRVVFPLATNKRKSDSMEFKTFLRKYILSPMGEKVKNICQYFLASNQEVWASPSKKLTEEFYAVWDRLLLGGSIAFEHLNVPFLNVLWPNVMNGVVAAHSANMMTVNAVQFVKYTRKTVATLILGRNGALKLVQAQLMWREKDRRKHGRAPGSLPSQEEKSLPAISLIRYYYGLIHQLCVACPSKVLFCLHSYLLSELCLCTTVTSFLHPIYGIANADPMTARMIQGYIHSTTATVFIKLCNTVMEGPTEFVIQESASENRAEDLFEFLRPQCFSDDERRGENMRESLLSLPKVIANADPVYASTTSTSGDEPSSVELHKLDLLLMILRTTPKLPVLLKSKMIPYLRWAVGLALNLFPFVGASHCQIERRLADFLRAQENAVRGTSVDNSLSEKNHDPTVPFGLMSPSNAACHDESASKRISYFSYFIQSIRLFLTDIPKNTGAELDLLLVELSAHTAPMCQTIAQHAWKMIFERRSGSQNANSIISLYQSVKSLGTTPVSFSLLNTIRNCLSLLNADDQNATLQKLFSPIPKIFQQHHHTGDGLILNEAIIKEAWAFQELLKVIPFQSMLPHCPRVATFLESRMLDLAINATMSIQPSNTRREFYDGIGKSKEALYFPSVQRLYVGLSCSLSLLNGVSSADIITAKANALWGNIFHAMPLIRRAWQELLRGMGPKAREHDAYTQKESEGSILVELLVTIASIPTRCPTLVTNNNLETHLLPWMSFLNDCIHSYDNPTIRIGNKRVSSVEVATSLSMLRLLKYSISVPLTSVVWVKNLNDRGTSRKFSDLFTTLVHQLWTASKYRLMSDNSWISYFATMELLSFCVRFDFGPLVSSHCQKGFYWCIPNGAMMDEVLKFHESSTNQDQRVTRQQPNSIEEKGKGSEGSEVFMPLSLTFNGTPFFCLETDGALTVNVLKSFYSKPDLVKLANMRGVDEAVATKLSLLQGFLDGLSSEFPMTEGDTGRNLFFNAEAMEQLKRKLELVQQNVSHILKVGLYAS